MNIINCIENAGIPLPALTLICAVLLPTLCALAVFLCLRKAPIARKAIVYFVLSPIYVALTVFVFSDVTDQVSKLIGIASGNFSCVGFLAALTLGIVYLSLASLICGAGIIRRGGAIVNAVVTLVCLILCGYLTVAVFGYCRSFGDTYTLIGSLPLSAVIPAVANVFPWASDVGADFIASATFVLFLIVYFLCFFAVNGKEYAGARIAGEDAGAENEDNGKSKKASRRGCSDEDRCCAYCERSRQLNGDRANVLCDLNGIVCATFVCRNFIYDPLKRAPGSFRGFGTDFASDDEESAGDKEDAETLNNDESGNVADESDNNND